MYEMSQRHPVWVAENHVNPCNSVWKEIPILGVNEPRSLDRDAFTRLPVTNKTSLGWSAGVQGKGMI